MTGRYGIWRRCNGFETRPCDEHEQAHLDDQSQIRVTLLLETRICDWQTVSAEVRLSHQARQKLNAQAGSGPKHRQRGQQDLSF